MMRLSSLLRTRVALTPYVQPRPFARHAAAAFSSQAHLSGTRFSSLEITENSKRAIRQELKYEFLTDVQEKTFAHIVQGKDILSKAKTGNGKTMAFLLPAIERIVRHGLNNTPNSIPMLVISPTRELAQQIAVEARKIGQFHDLHVACFVGGTSVHKDAQTLKGAKPVDILVATPGRLLDHIDQDSGHIRKLLRKLQFLVLDEADRLLDMGFRNEVVKILNSVPAQRQTLLFSATLPKSTQELTKLALRKDFELIDTVSDGEEQTNVQVQQEYVVCRATEVVATVENVLAAHIAQFPSNYKVIAFFPTARAAQFMAQLFSAAGFKGVLEIHSRKSQVARTKTAAKFRESSRVMLFSSDVSARGVDYPDVTLVLQVGLTDRDSYIHRLGRTARGGSQGRGVLVLADFEKAFLNDLKGLPLGKYAKNEAVVESRTAKTMATLAQNPELAKSAMQSYQAWLGFYHSNLRRLGMNKEELVQMAEVYSQTIGLQEVPRLDTKILRKMGMFGIAGLVPADEKERRPRSASGPTRNNSKQVSSAPHKSNRENADGDSGESNWNDRGRSQSRERSEDRKGRGRSQPRERSDEWNNRGRSQSREPSEDWNDRGRSASRGEWSDRKRRSSSFPRTARRTDSRGPSRGGRR